MIKKHGFSQKLRRKPANFLPMPSLHHKNKILFGPKLWGELSCLMPSKTDPMIQRDLRRRCIGSMANQSADPGRGDGQIRQLCLQYPLCNGRSADITDTNNQNRAYHLSMP